MKARKIRDGIYWMGAVDWDRRLFDSLIPLPDGTSYNAYLVEGSEKNGPAGYRRSRHDDVLMAQLQECSAYRLCRRSPRRAGPFRVHSPGSGAVRGRPGCRHAQGQGDAGGPLCIPAERVISRLRTGETLSLGDKTLEFIYTPWVHWPETMVTYLQEDHILFSLRFLWLAPGHDRPVRHRRMARLRGGQALLCRDHDALPQDHPEEPGEDRRSYEIDLIAPSHGPVYDRPAFILDAYRDWISEEPKNVVVAALHLDARQHAEDGRIPGQRAGRARRDGAPVRPGRDRHREAGHRPGRRRDDRHRHADGARGPASHRRLRRAPGQCACGPRPRFASIIGSYGWSSKAVEQIAGLIPNLKVEILDPVLCKGFPREKDFKALDNLAASIAEKHRELNLA